MRLQQRLQKLSLLTRRNGRNDFPLKNAVGSRVLAAGCHETFLVPFRRFLGLLLLSRSPPRVARAEGIKLLKLTRNSGVPAIAAGRNLVPTGNKAGYLLLPKAAAHDDDSAEQLASDLAVDLKMVIPIWRGIEALHDPRDGRRVSNETGQGGRLKAGGAKHKTTFDGHLCLVYLGPPKADSFEVAIATCYGFLSCTAKGLLVGIKARPLQRERFTVEARGRKVRFRTWDGSCWTAGDPVGVVGPRAADGPASEFTLEYQANGLVWITDSQGRVLFAGE
jgi:hypothetical protein